MTWATLSTPRKCYLLFATCDEVRRREKDEGKKKKAEERIIYIYIDMDNVFFLKN